MVAAVSARALSAADMRLLGPGRDQAPAQHREVVAVLTPADRRDLLAWRGVVAGLQVQGRSRKPEIGVDLPPRVALREPPAHGSRLPGGMMHHHLFRLCSHAMLGHGRTSAAGSEAGSRVQHRAGAEQGASPVAQEARVGRLQPLTDGCPRGRRASGSLRHPMLPDATTLAERNRWD